MLKQLIQMFMWFKVSLRWVKRASALSLVCVLLLGATKQSVVDHEVRSGNTLWGLSGTYLKDHLQWPVIVDHNEAIVNPNLIYVGQNLKIPQLINHPGPVIGINGVEGDADNYRFLWMGLYKPRIDTVFKGGNKRNLIQMGMLVPLLQNPTSLLFFHGVGMRDSRTAQEGNLGIGYRQFCDDGILGAYGYYDKRRTQNNNVIEQLTFGLEYLREKVEYRANLYFPKKTKFLIPGSAKYSEHYVGHRRDVRAGQQLEVPLYGFDLETGSSQLFYERLAAFLAYYHFNAKGITPMDGVRLRAAWKLIDWVSLEGEVSYDPHRNVTFFLGGRLSFTLDNKNQFKQKGDALSQKMTQPPVRDIDIISKVVDKEEIILSTGDDVDVLSLRDNNVLSDKRKTNRRGRSHSVLGGVQKTIIIEEEGTNKPLGAVDEHGQILLTGGKGRHIGLSSSKIIDLVLDAVESPRVACVKEDTLKSLNWLDKITRCNYLKFDQKERIRQMWARYRLMHLPASAALPVAVLPVGHVDLRSPGGAFSPVRAMSPLNPDRDIRPPIPAEAIENFPVDDLDVWYGNDGDVSEFDDDWESDEEFIGADVREASDAENASAVSIQALVRGWQVRNQLRKAKEVWAATKVQAIARGIQARRQADRIRADREQDAAARKIQRFVRSRNVRKNLPGVSLPVKDELEGEINRGRVDLSSVPDTKGLFTPILVSADSLDGDMSDKEHAGDLFDDSEEEFKSPVHMGRIGTKGSAKRSLTPRSVSRASTSSPLEVLREVDFNVKSPVVTPETVTKLVKIGASLKVASTPSKFSRDLSEDVRPWKSDNLHKVRGVRHDLDGAMFKDDSHSIEHAYGDVRSDVGSPILAGYNIDTANRSRDEFGKDEGKGHDLSGTPGSQLITNLSGVADNSNESELGFKKGRMRFGVGYDSTRGKGYSSRGAKFGDLSPRRKTITTKKGANRRRRTALEESASARSVSSAAVVSLMKQAVERLPTVEQKAASLIQRNYRDYVNRKKAHSKFKVASARTQRMELIAERDNAATTIQAAVRGKKARSEFKAVKDAAITLQTSERARKARKEADKRRVERDAATKIQAAERARQARKEAAKLRSERDAATKIQTAERARQARKEADKRRGERDAAIKIQSVERGRQARKEAAKLRSERDAATKIQTAERARQARKEADKRRGERGAAIKIQSVERGRQARKELAKLRSEREAATKIQAVERARQARKEADKRRGERDAATMIQAAERGRQARRELAKRKIERDAATKIQAAERARQARREADKRRGEREAATKIQAAERARQARKEADKRRGERDAATKIQAVERGRQARREADKRRGERDAAIKIQSVERGRQARKEADKRRAERDAATKIQAAERARQARKEADKRRGERNAATKIQAAERARQARKELVKLRSERDAAIKIQSVARGRQARREADKRRGKRDAATKIQTAERARQARKELAKLRSERDAATKIQAAERSRQARKELVKLRSERDAAIKIQSVARGRQARREADKRRGKRDAATKIQTEERARQARKKFAKRRGERDAATKIQAAERGRQARKELAKLRSERDAATKVQAVERARQARKEADKRRGERDAATKIQTAERARQARKEAAKLRSERDAAIKIQSAERGRQARKELAKLRSERAAATKIQAAERARQARKELAKRRGERDAAIKIQSVERGRQARKEADKRRGERNAATKIQAAERARQARKEADKRRGERDAAIKIQSVERGRQARKEADKRRGERNAAIKIQSVERGRQARKEADKRRGERDAAIKIQSVERARKARKEADKLRSERDAATKIQAVERGRQARKEADKRRAERDAAIKIQSVARGRQARKELAKLRSERDAATKIQAAERARQARKEADKRRGERDAAIKIQSVERGRQARTEADKRRGERDASNKNSICRTWAPS